MNLFLDSFSNKLYPVRDLKVRHFGLFYIPRRARKRFRFDDYPFFKLHGMIKNLTGYKMDFQHDSVPECRFNRSYDDKKSTEQVNENIGIILFSSVVLLSKSPGSIWSNLNRYLLDHILSFLITNYIN
jgi:hypothetical protein